LAALIVVASFGLALAKLPPPPPMDDTAKAAAEQKKAKDAEAAKQVQTRAEDRVAARYIAEQKAKGIIVTPQMGPGTGAPTDAAKGLSSQPEKAMAHSPAKK
jgi:hypothetical protein